MTNSISTDLIQDILSRLPVKSVARFRCLSKLWCSTLTEPYFTELFLARSSARPRLLFAVEQSGLWSFFSLLQNPHDKYSSSPDFHIKFAAGENKRLFSINCQQFLCGYASGLIFFSRTWSLKLEEKLEERNVDMMPVICNPNTGQYAILPCLLTCREKWYSFVGFDPIHKEFKVLFMDYSPSSNGHKILTVETGMMTWRTIQCPLDHKPCSEGICINGVLYYLGDDQEDVEEYKVIVCFDVRSEKFKFIRLNCEWPTTLVDYKGKLCMMSTDDDGDIAIELRMWVLEDVEKEEWLKSTYTFWDDKLNDGPLVISVVGVNATTGEVVLSIRTNSKLFYVFYFDPERNTLQSVEVKGFEKYDHVHTFANHVEDLSHVNDAKLFKSSSFSAPNAKNKRKRKRKHNVLSS